MKIEIPRCKTPANVSAQNFILERYGVGLVGMWVMKGEDRFFWLSLDS